MVVNLLLVRLYETPPAMEQICKLFVLIVLSSNQIIRSEAQLRSKFRRWIHDL